MFDGHINWPFHIFFMSFYTGAAILFWWLDRKRHKDFGYAAKMLHLAHFDPPPKQVDQLTQKLHFFAQRPGVVHEYIGGAYRQRHVQVFNYTFRKPRNPEMPQVFACVYIELETPLPDLRIAPNDSRKAWQGDDLVFTEAQQFHERYKLRSRAPQQAKALLSDQVLDFFSRWDNIEIEVGATRFLFTVRDPLQPISLQHHLDRAFALAALFNPTGKPSL